MIPEYPKFSLLYRPWVSSFSLWVHHLKHSLGTGTVFRIILNSTENPSMKLNKKNKIASYEIGQVLFCVESCIWVIAHQNHRDEHLAVKIAFATSE